MTHPLLSVLLDAAHGRPPTPDGTVEVLPPLAGPVDAVVTFTARGYLVADVDAELVRSRLRGGDPGAPTLPAFLTWLAGQLGARAGQVDAVLAAPGLDGAPPLELETRADLEHHHRVTRASRYRRDLRVFASAGDAGVLVLGRALAARHLVPHGEPVFVQVSPGNAASLRAILAAGYHPLGSEVLFSRSGPED